MIDKVRIKIYSPQEVLHCTAVHCLNRSSGACLHSSTWSAKVKKCSAAPKFLKVAGEDNKLINLLFLSVGALAVIAFRCRDSHISMGKFEVV